jgi:hypothetical protein
MRQASIDSKGELKRIPGETKESLYLFLVAKPFHFCFGQPFARPAVLRLR